MRRLVLAAVTISVLMSVLAPAAGAATPDLPLKNGDFAGSFGPDECDPCEDLPNKLYCGREIPGWRLENAAAQIQCMNGAFVRLRQCTTCTNGQQTLCQ